MMSHMEQEVPAWLRETSGNWSESPHQWSADKAGFSSSGLVDDDALLLDKVNDDKHARDVEDLSAIFEELEDGVVDFVLPCDEEEVATGVEVTEDWIGDLEKDAVNVDELSAVFDGLVAEQASAFKDTESLTSADEEEEDEEMDDSETESCFDEDTARDGRRADGSVSVEIVPSPPTWASFAPLDPRCVIRTPVFANVDSRIPRIEMPRMDLGFGGRGLAMTPMVSPMTSSQSTSVVSPKPCREKASAASPYKHDPATCWICKSDKSAYKKYALHRYLEKRHRRNWKRGPRYSGRSNVATGRVRQGGRFICTAHWV